MLSAPIAPGAVSSPDDRIQCERLRCNTAARVCADRQVLAVPWANRRRKLSRYELSEAAATHRYAVCRNCAQGRVVAARLGVTVPTEDRAEAPGRAPTRGGRWRAAAGQK
ncbi:hypothetical protein [Sorangium sp. So ce388]|uniref:hypothetical protein n=1 Tax=Sorangium sp. So ce388 TaxID=3133309 RepID=UPI003F5BBBAB